MNQDLLNIRIPQEIIDHLPKYIRIGHYSVAFIKWDARAAHSSRAWGEFSAEEMAIRVDVQQDPMKVLDVIMHEIIHAIYFAYGLSSEANEEDVCRTVSKALVQVMRDNKPLFLIMDKIMADYEQQTC